MLESVDLTPTNSAGSYAMVSWTFPGGVNCANADTPAQQLGGVRYVDIQIDNEPSVRANCVDGAIANGGQGVYSATTAPGNHTVYLTGLTSNLYPLFYASSAITTQVGTPVANQMAFQWGVGGVVVSWSLQNTTGASQTCTSANNPYVYVNFVDSTNTAVYPNPGDTNTCDAAPTRYFYLPAAGGVPTTGSTSAARRTPRPGRPPRIRCSW